MLLALAVTSFTLNQNYPGWGVLVGSSSQFMARGNFSLREANHHECLSRRLRQQSSKWSSRLVGYIFKVVNHKEFNHSLSGYTFWHGHMTILSCDCRCEFSETRFLVNELPCLACIIVVIYLGPVTEATYSHCLYNCYGKWKTGLFVLKRMSTFMHPSIQVGPSVHQRIWAPIWTSQRNQPWCTSSLVIVIVISQWMKAMVCFK